MEYAIIIAIVIVVIFVVGYYILRFMKGKIELHLTERSAASGESITGSINVVAKKALQGRLTVSLVCMEEYREQDHRYDDDDDDSNNDTVKQREIFRDEQVLEDRKIFSPTNGQEYQFEIVVPTASESRQRDAGIAGSARNAGSGIMGTLLDIATAEPNSWGKHYWHVESRLDMKGIDLFAKKKVNIRMTR